MKNFKLFFILTGFVLTACGASATPPPEPTVQTVPTNTAVPSPTTTIEPSPTPTPIPPLESQPVAHESVSQFASAMQKAGINVTAEQILQQGLLIQTILGTEGSQYEIATTYIDPDPARTGESLEGDYPLLVRAEDEGEWNAVTLKKMARIIGLTVGRESSAWLFGSKPALELAAEQIDKATITTVTWSTVQPTRNSPIGVRGIDWHLMSWEGTGVQLQGPHLVYPTTTYGVANWLMNGSFTREELTEILINYVTQVVTYGKEKGIHEWVVVNEPYLPGYRENDVFYRTFGDYSYIQIAFEAARKADPSATLIYNDTDNHSQGGLTTALTKKIVSDLKEEGLIDAVGIQAHIGDWVRVPDVDDVRTTLEAYQIPVIVTEFDYSLTKEKGDEFARNRKQAIVYHDLIGVFLDVGVKDITFWSIDDATSWLEKEHIGVNPSPTMFDKQFEPKAAYYSTLKAMFDFIK